MFAYIAAVLFAIAVALGVAGARLGTLTPSVFLAAGLLCLSLQVAGVRLGARDAARNR